MSPQGRRLPLLAYHNYKFMESWPARPLRILAEYLDPLERLKAERVGDTIVMFGSARVLPRERAEANLTRLKKSLRGPLTPEQKRRLQAARRALEMSQYYEDARALARRITEWARTLGENPRRFVICSGGGPGIMEAANRGASEAGGKSIGLSIEIPREQRTNRFISPELDFQFHYFFMRKLWFAQLAKALIVFPGGFGTMDELWEMLTLSQTGKIERRHLILMYGRKWWQRVIDFRAMVAAGTISERDYALLEFADTVEEAFVRVRRHMEKYHPHPDPPWWE
jgi:uncharacterized protein (TIGR00730 family)